MNESSNQIEIAGNLISSPQMTKANFDKRDIKFEASSDQPSIMIFSSKYVWDEQGDDQFNDWDFFLTVTDEAGKVLQSEFKHFGEEETGFVGDTEEAYQEYIVEEARLKVYKDEDHHKKGDGMMVRSIKTPLNTGKYVFKCRIVAQFWARNLGEPKGLEKNKVEASDECLVHVTVK